MSLSTQTPSSLTPQVPIDAYKADPNLEAAVKYATENCRPQIESTETMSDAQLKGMEDVMSKMDIKTCSWDKKSKDKKGGGAICCPIVVAVVGTKEVEQSATGCEQINVVSNIVSQCTQQLSCMLNQATASTTTNVRVYQKINAEFMGNIYGNIDLKNTSVSNIKTLNLTQSTVQSAIGATITAGINDAIDQTSKTQNEAFSDPTGQKSFTSSLFNLQQVASNTTINQSVADTSNNLIVNQEIYVKVYKDVTGDFKVTNENVIQLIAENYVYNALDQVLKTDAGVDFLKKISQENTQENKGVSTDVDLSSITNALSSIFSSITSMFSGVFLIIAFIVLIFMFGGSKFIKYLTPIGWVRMLTGGGKKKQQQQKNRKQ